MTWRRGWISLFLFTLAMINYVDRVALSVASKPIAEEFGLSPVTMGYLFSSFLWTYLLCLIPMGILVDRLGTQDHQCGGHHDLVGGDHAHRRFLELRLADRHAAGHGRRRSHHVSGRRARGARVDSRRASAA